MHIRPTLMGSSISAFPEILGLTNRQAHSIDGSVYVGKIRDFAVP